MGDAAEGREGTSVLITDLLITDYFPVSSEENAGFGTLSPYLRPKTKWTSNSTQ